VIRLRAATAIALSAVLTCSAAADGSEPSPIPVITRLSGLVTLSSAQAGTHELVSTELLNGSTMVLTDKIGSATIELSDVGDVRMGSSGQLTVGVANGKLYVTPQNGLACIRAQQDGIIVRIGGYDLEPQTPAIIETAASSRSVEFAVVAGGANVTTEATTHYVPPGHPYVIVLVNGFIHAAPPMPTTIGSWHCSQ